MDLGGIENALRNYYRSLDHTKVQFDFLLTASGKCHFEEEIKIYGGRIYRIPPLSKKNPFKYFIGIKNFLKDHPEYNIWHAHSASKSVIPLFIAKKNGVRNLISHSHTASKLKGLNGILREILKSPLKKTAGHWFACSEEAAKFLYGVNSSADSRIRILKNVIDTDRFEYSAEKREKIRKKLGLSDNTILIGTVGRLSAVKNQTFILEILNNLIKDGQDAKVIFVGDGESRKMLENYASSLSLNEYCFFTGGVANVEDYYNAMDVFLLPSFREGLGMAAIEAQATGLRCIVSTGVPEECNVTGNVEFLPLDKGAEYWGKKISETDSHQRKSEKQKLIMGGYDASTEASKLQEFYINLS